MVEGAYPALKLPHPPGFFEPLRRRLLDSLGIQRDDQSVSRDSVGASVATMPKLVYLDRQADRRRLVEEDHEALFGVLRRLESQGRATVAVAKLEDIQPEEQVRLFVDADVSVAKRVLEGIGYAGCR